MSLEGANLFKMPAKLTAENRLKPPESVSPSECCSGHEK